MKYLYALIFSLSLNCLVSPCKAQRAVNGESVRYQQERMVFKQWDQKKFTPTSGFLGLNPWYWLTWGWFYPNYHKSDLRPLSPFGPQTQRLALVGTMNSTDASYKLQSDTIRNTALSEIAARSGLISAADPLWQLYYSNELKPVLNNSMSSILSGLTPAVSQRLTADGIYDWYKNELDRLKERLEGARTADMDRGSRIMAYHRMLREYRDISAVWAIRTASAQTTIDLTDKQQKLKSNTVTVPGWTPQSDIEIARKVLTHIQ
jgi:hypothetical protein